MKNNFPLLPAEERKEQEEGWSLERGEEGSVTLLTHDRTFVTCYSTTD